MRLCFFGSASFAVPSLRALHSAGHDIVSVFTQPDRPAGRGGHLRGTPVKDCAVELGIPVVQPEHLDAEALTVLQQCAPEAAVIIAYGMLVPAAMLAAVPRGWLNLHPSLLPKYRGAAPVPHCILNGDAETGVTVFRLNEKFDKGDILAVEKIPLPPAITSGELLEKLSHIGADLMARVLARPVWEFLPQSGEKSSYARKFTKDDGIIDWAEAAAVIDRKVRAYQPWPLARTCWGAKARQLTVTAVELTGRAAAAAPGTVEVGKNEILVACADQWLRLARVLPEGKAEMTGAEFLRGARLQSGDRLGGNVNNLNLTDCD